MKKPPVINQENPVQKIESPKEGFMRRSVMFTDFVNNHSYLVLFISTPFLSLFFWIFYKRKKLFYAEHLTSVVFFNSFLMIITSLIFGPLIYFTRHLNLYNIWLVLMLSFHILYFAFAYKQLFNYKGLQGFMKTLGISLLATLCWMIFSITLGTSYIIWGP